MPKIEIDSVPVKTGAIYDAIMAGRSSLRLGEAGALTRFKDGGLV